jgi:hypothetical protein
MLISLSPRLSFKLSAGCACTEQVMQQVIHTCRHANASLCRTESQVTRSWMRLLGAWPDLHIHVACDSVPRASMSTPEVLLESQPSADLIAPICVMQRRKCMLGSRSRHFELRYLIRPWIPLCEAFTLAIIRSYSRKARAREN